MRGFLLLLMLLGASLPAYAEDLVAGLSQDSVSITANFDGSDILIFGALKGGDRTGQAEAEAPVEVIVTVSGPREMVTIRRKANVSGIWINRDLTDISAAPSFYAVSTTGPLAEILSEAEDHRLHVSIERAIGRVIAHDGVTDGADFAKALIRIRKEAGLYRLMEGGTALLENTLFRTTVRLPANLVEGDYDTRILLTRGGVAVGEYKTAISVRKVGLERWIYNLAYDAPLLYSLLSLVIAIAAGWAASAFFRAIRF